jgi:hypothetical protein
MSAIRIAFLVCMLFGFVCLPVSANVSFEHGTVTGTATVAPEAQGLWASWTNWPHGAANRCDWTTFKELGLFWNAREGKESAMPSAPWKVPTCRSASLSTGVQIAASNETFPGEQPLGMSATHPASYNLSAIRRPQDAGLPSFALSVTNKAPALEGSPVSQAIVASKMPIGDSRVRTGSIPGTIPGLPIIAVVFLCTVIAVEFADRGFGRSLVSVPKVLKSPPRLVTNCLGRASADIRAFAADLRDLILPEQTLTCGVAGDRWWEDPQAVTKYRPRFEPSPYVAPVSPSREDQLMPPFVSLDAGLEEVLH